MECCAIHRIPVLVMQKKRIFWKLYPSYLIVTLLSLLTVSILASTAISRFLERQTTINLNEQANLIGEQARVLFSAQEIEPLNRISIMLSSNSTARITLILPDGEVAGDSDKAISEMGNHRDRPEIKDALSGRTGRFTRYSNTLKKNMMYVAVPVFDNGSLVGVVRTAMPLAKMDQVIGKVLGRIIWGGGSVLALSALFSLIISRRISGPMERIKLGAERFADGDFSHRLNTTGSTEVFSLANTMNQMADQLEERLQNLTHERNQREAILSSMVEGVLAVDTHGNIISLNKAAATFFQVVEPDTVKGRSIEEVFRNVRLQKFIGSVLKGQGSGECEITVQHNEPCHLQAFATNLLGAQGDRIGIVIVFNDVSRVRHLEDLRRDFVANVSHELKTPITAIKGFIETLMEGAMNDPVEANHFLKIVAKHADRLNAIIDDLLALSRLEQGDKTEMDLQEVFLADLIHSAIEVCVHRAEKKRITIESNCPEGLSAHVNPPLIEQALVNLIWNAVKYSADGKTVSVAAKAGQGEVILSVNDEGYGIEAEHLERLFERFYRVDKGRSRQEGGTGLGLAIVKHIAQAHRGSVSVKSTFGKGSSFSMILPSTVSAPES